MRVRRILTVIVALLGAWTCGAAPAGAYTADEYFVARVHQDFLLRSPTDAELADGAAAVAATSRGIWVRDLLRGAEFEAMWVTGVHLRYLDREATPAEVTSGLSAIGTGHDYLAAELQVLAGAEYHALAGGTHGGFVDQIYDDILYRSPSPSDRAYWIDRLATGTTRLWLANYFVRSTESANLRVGGPSSMTTCPAVTIDEVDAWAAGSYCLVLDRVADGTGRTHWTGQLSGTAQLPDLWRSLASSNEYHTLAQPVP